MFPYKTCSLGGLKVLIKKKLTTQVLLFDILGSGQPCIVHTVSVLVQGQVTIIFVVSVSLSVCLSVCLFVQSFSQPSSI